MSMKLRRTLRIETVDEAGRLVTRMYIGDDELPSDPTLLRAVAQLAAGAPVLDVQRLHEAGVLEVTEVPMPPEEVRVVMDPFATFEFPQRPVAVTLPSDSGPVQRRVEVQGDLPLDVFVPPHHLRPLQDLARKVRVRWHRELTRSVAADGSVDREAVAQRLGAWATSEVESDPALHPVLRTSGDRLEPMSALQDDCWHYPVGGIRLYADRLHAEGQRAARGTVAFSAQGGAQEALDILGSIGRMMGMLQRGSTGSEVMAALTSSPATAEQLWRQMARADLLPPYMPRPGLHEGMTDGQARFLGHGTLLVQLGGAHVCIDPWFVPSSSADAPPALVDLPELSGLFFTGADWDRVNFDTLMRMDKSTPCFVPAQPAEGCVPRLDRFLTAMGFSDVRTMGPGEAVTIGTDGVMEAAKMWGRDPTRSGAAHHALVWSSGGHTALLHNGGGIDSEGNSILTGDVMAGLVSTYGPLRQVFASRRCEQGCLVDYGWSFLLRPFSEWTQRTVYGFSDESFLADLAEAAQAESLVLIGEGGAPWYPTGRVGIFSEPSEAEAAGWPSQDDIAQRVAVPVQMAEVGKTY